MSPLLGGYDAAVRLLTKPTSGRLVLWLILALIWFLLLAQDLAMDPHHRHVSWLGAAFWTVVLAWLLSCALVTHRRRRDARTE